MKETNSKKILVYLTLKSHLGNSCAYYEFMKRKVASSHIKFIIKFKNSNLHFSFVIIKLKAQPPMG